MKLLLLHNRNAGSGSIPAERLQRAFTDAGFEVTYRSRQDDEVGEEDLRQADALVVAGGDGTVAGAVRRFRRKIGRFGIVPLGTANNIATGLGITGGAEAVARGLRDAVERPVDIGLAAWPGGGQEFLEGVGAGPIAEAMATVEAQDLEAEAMRQRSMDLLPDCIARARPQGWRVRVDGRELPDDLLLVEVLNGPLIGPGLLPAPNGQPGDGMFDVAFLRPEHQAACVAALRRDPLPRPLPLEVVRGRQVTMEVPGAALRIDDRFLEPDAQCHELSLSFASGQVRFLVPEAA
jgi:diacylglycerol kinase family enzyme